MGHVQFEKGGWLKNSIFPHGSKGLLSIISLLALFLPREIGYRMPLAARL